LGTAASASQVKQLSAAIPLQVRQVSSHALQIPSPEFPSAKCKAGQLAAITHVLSSYFLKYSVERPPGIPSPQHFSQTVSASVYLH